MSGLQERIGKLFTQLAPASGSFSSLAALCGDELKKLQICFRKFSGSGSAGLSARCVVFQSEMNVLCS